MDDQFVFAGRFPKGRVMLVQGQEVSGLRDQPLERIGNMIDRRLLGRKFGQRRGLPGGRRRVGEAHREVDHLRHRELSSSEVGFRRKRLRETCTLPANDASEPAVRAAGRSPCTSSNAFA